MWELTIELVEDNEIYFCYKFTAFGSLMEFIASNQRHNTEHCIYTIEKVDEING